jgi:sulfatase maturation enzyme AslB (radical SAM superfamily)
MNSSNNLWCPLPWSHIAVKSNGALRVCSHSQSGGNKNTLLEKDGKTLRIDDIATALNSDTLKDIRLKFINNEWPEQCRRCKIEQEAGKRSRNQWEATMYEFTKEDAVGITLADGTLTSQQILSMDLRLGNKCNLQCVMCYPGESNQWNKIQEQITGSKVFMIDDVTYTTDGHKHFEWCDQEEYYQLLTTHAMYLQKIKFGGGEPWLVKQHLTLLRNLLEQDLAKNIELEYSINVTIVPQEFLRTIDQFKFVKLCCSVDGYGEVNEAIRYPTKWSVVEKNLDFLDTAPPNSAIFTSTTISILNIEHFVTWMQWLESKKFKKINTDTFSGVVSHPVMNPKYLNLGLMTIEQATRMFDYLKEQATNADMLTALEQWEEYTKTLPITDEEIIQGRKDLADFFVRMSTIQGKDWKEIFPKCYEMIQEWND